MTSLSVACTHCFCAAATNYWFIEPEVCVDPTSAFCAFRIMHDEVSETENIRKNLAIERMIVDGCEVLLDTSQTFVRQGMFIPLTGKDKY